jgi:hypothetical protein
MTSLATIINWFRTGKYPTEQQFADTFSSFWHKSENIPSAKIDGGYNTATSLDAFPADKALLVVNLQTDGNFFNPDGGVLQSSMTIILKNNTAAELTQAIPNTGDWDSWDGDQIILPPQGIAEINIIKADKYYIMFKIKEQ